MMIAWSMWESTQVLHLTSSVLALGGPDDGVDLHGQVGRRGQDAVQAQRQEALPSWTAWPPPRWPRPGRSAPRAAASGPGPWRTTGTCCPRAPATWAASWAAWAGRLARMCRTAIMTRTTPSTILIASPASDGAVAGLGGSLPVAVTVTVTTMARDTSQPNTNAAPLRAPRLEGSTTRKAVSGSGSTATARPTSSRSRTSTAFPRSHPAQTVGPGQVPAAPSAAVICSMAAVSSGLTACPCSRWAAATLSARARTKCR